MAEDTRDRKMTIRELLEARERVRTQIVELGIRGEVRRASNFASQNKSKLTAILEQIEAELADLGVKDA